MCTYAWIFFPDVTQMFVKYFYLSICYLLIYSPVISAPIATFSRLFILFVLFCLINPFFCEGCIPIANVSHSEIPEAYSAIVLR